MERKALKAVINDESMMYKRQRGGVLTAAEFNKLLALMDEYIANGEPMKAAAEFMTWDRCTTQKQYEKASRLAHKALEGR